MGNELNKLVYYIIQEEVINLQFENNRLKFLNKNLTDGAKEGMETSSVISSPFSSPDKASSVTPVCFYL